MASSNHEISLFNTLTRRVEPFKPLEENHVRLYCCGPTVYNYQHVGNLRTYIFEDLLARTLRYAGFRVTHVMNITDVGHLVSDADEGEDKMSVAARREGKSSLDIAKFYTDIFFDHCAKVHIERPTIVCKATDHIPQMIELIRRLEQQGLAYQAGGNVYFDVSRFPNYGKLAQLDLESLKSSARIDVDTNKRHPLDFALWFTKSKFENQELQWDSPWGRGYPGWHIECSAMSMNYLGEEFDIHCGGIDHIPVHHTNEIAQSEGATNRPLARFWMHGGFLVTDSAKMSKSTGEFLTLDRLLERGYDPLSYRLLCLGTSYRSELSWSWQALDGAANALAKLRSAVFAAREGAAANPFSGQYSPAAQEKRDSFRDAVFTDLGIPKALAILYSVAYENEIAPSEKLALMSEMDFVFGMGIATWEEEAVPVEMVRLAEQREAARKRRDFAEADRLRNLLSEHGYTVEDGKDGFKVKKS